MRTIDDYLNASAVDNVRRALEAAKEDDTHALLSLIPERALERAKTIDANPIKGKLAGVPFVAKDNYLAFGAPTTAASVFLEELEAPIQATAIEKLEAEGAICIGKANLDSFAHGGSTENSAFGPTVNAIDKDRVAGGSSGGSAVVVARDIVPFSLGTDTGGSIRQPASFNGVVGVKPTYGTISRYGVISMASSTDTLGCFAHTVADAELVTRIMAGSDNRDATSLPNFFDDPKPATDARYDIGVIEEFMGDGTDAGVRQNVEHYIERLQSAGHSVKRVSLPLVKYSLAMYYIIVPAEIASNLARYDGVRYGRRAEASTIETLYGKSRDEGFVTESKRRIMIGNYVLSSGYFDAYYQKAQKARTLLIRQFDDLFSKCDVLLSPVAATTAFKLGQNVDDPIKMYLNDAMTVAVSLAGIPALSVPAGTHDGLPVGVQLISNQRHDSLLFDLASSMELMS